MIIGQKHNAKLGGVKFKKLFFGVSFSKGSFTNCVIVWFAFDTQNSSSFLKFVILSTSANAKIHENH